MSGLSLFTLALLVITSLSFKTPFCRINYSRRLTVRRFSESSDDDSIKSADTSGKGFGKKVVQAPVIKDEEETSKPETMDAASFRIATKTPRQKREEELDAKMAQLREEEELLATDPSVGAVPELVANRMIARIAVFLGVPVFGGLSLFVIFFFMSRKYDIVVPPTIVAYATQAPFILGLLGITYGIMSSSWDDAPGSLLGFTEAKTNFKRIMDGLERTRQTNELREEIDREKEKLNRK